MQSKHRMMLGNQSAYMDLLCIISRLNVYEDSLVNINHKKEKCQNEKKTLKSLWRRLKGNLYDSNILK
jgi:hypothetical protein